jgi:TonB family protein
MTINIKQASRIIALCLCFAALLYTPVKAQEEQVYTSVETPPEFPGGLDKLLGYLNTNIRYPADAISRNAEGRVVVQFTIEKDGTLSDIHVLTSPDSSLTKEAIRVMAASPAWLPGIQDNKKVRVQFTIPVRFKLPQPFAFPDTSKYKGQIYSSTQQSPEFPGGTAKFGEYLGKNIYYPVEARKKNIQGRVIVQFIVEADGNLSNLNVLRSPDESLSREAVRVLEKSPKWVPGRQDGIAVRVLYTVPIAFTLTGR